MRTATDSAAPTAVTSAAQTPASSSAPAEFHPTIAQSDAASSASERNKKALHFSSTKFQILANKPKIYIRQSLQLISYSENVRRWKTSAIALTTATSALQYVPITTNGTPANNHSARATAGGGNAADHYESKCPLTSCTASWHGIFHNSSIIIFFS